MEHRAAPDHRLVRVDEEADRDHLHAERGERADALAVLAGGPRAEEAHHQRDARAVDVGVEQADLRAELRERDRDVGGDGALADAALAAADEDDVLDRRHEVVRVHRLRRRAAHRPGERDLDARELQGRQRRPDRLFDARLVRRSRRRQLDAHAHAAAVEQLRALEHGELGERAAGRGVLHVFERCENLLGSHGPRKMRGSARQVKASARGAARAAPSSACRCRGRSCR